MEKNKRNEQVTEDGIRRLYNSWSTLLNATGDGVQKGSGMPPRPPHLDDCKLNVRRNKKLDGYGDNATFPPWTLWKGSLGLQLLNLTTYEENRELVPNARAEKHYPPWVCKLGLNCNIGERQRLPECTTVFLLLLIFHVRIF
jgi:hypothetical protein